LNIRNLQINHSQQKDQSDCGVVCLQTILNYYNSYVSLGKLREHSGTSKQGTTMLGLIQCGNKIGLKIKGYESSIEALKENKT